MKSLLKIFGAIFIVIFLISMVTAFVEHIVQELGKGNFVPFAVAAVPLGVIFGPRIYGRAKPFAMQKLLPFLSQRAPKRIGEKLSELAMRDEDADRELMEKAIAEFNQIQRLMKKLDHRGLLSEVKELQLRSKRILDYLASHPERIHSASRFINYYQHKTLGMLGQYVSLDAVGVETSSENKSLAEELTRTFHGFSEAYQKELRKIAGAELQDMEAEIKLAGHMLRDDGILPLPRESATAENAPAAERAQENHAEDYARIDGLVYEMPEIFKKKNGVTEKPAVERAS